MFKELYNAYSICDTGLDHYTKEFVDKIKNSIIKNFLNVYDNQKHKVIHMQIGGQVNTEDLTKYLDSQNIPHVVLTDMYGRISAIKFKREDLIDKFEHYKQYGW